jgi:hypothetical protein
MWRCLFVVGHDSGKVTQIVIVVGPNVPGDGQKLLDHFGPIAIEQRSGLEMLVLSSLTKAVAASSIVKVGRESPSTDINLNR